MPFLTSNPYRYEFCVAW